MSEDCDFDCAGCGRRCATDRAEKAEALLEALKPVVQAASDVHTKRSERTRAIGYLTVDYIVQFEEMDALYVALDSLTDEQKKEMGLDA